MMKKISGVIIAILFGIVALFSIAGCGGKDNSAYENQIAELQEQITELQQTVNDNNGEVDELQGHIDELQQSVEGKDLEIELLQEYLAGVLRDDQEKTTKFTFSLDYAYENGFITREDIMHFCYYNYGSVYEGELNQTRTMLDFTPTEEQGVISESTAALITSAYFMENIDEFCAPGKLYVRAESFLIGSYFVTSDGYCIVQIKNNKAGSADVVKSYYCAGITWTRPTPEVYCVFKYN